MAGELSSVAANASAALDLEADDIDEALIRRARVLMIDGFLLSRTTLMTRIFELADYYGTCIALDLALPRIASESASFIVDMARRSPLMLFMNEAEANALTCTLKTVCPTRVKHSMMTSLPESCDLAQGRPLPIAVVKRAEKASSSTQAAPYLPFPRFARTL